MLLQDFTGSVKRLQLSEGEIVLRVSFNSPLYLTSLSVITSLLVNLFYQWLCTPVVIKLTRDDLKPCCTGNIFYSAAIVAIKMSVREEGGAMQIREEARGNEIQRRHTYHLTPLWRVSREACLYFNGLLPRRCSFQNDLLVFTAAISTLSRSDVELITSL